ncbi:MOSC domain-containing protein [Alphaproteobacteria bacterium GH1-50]|uniref:MOSC domain-containing protein n=1 Tax=Kangsaoukella pontilimi TaxID=2691042 RepID=A0A7C9J4C5_9RHOB|nr:MOSC domain-containing protein [Kangsaoukella pontilimi]MXQ08721.1 MOSC domain-containing protein [Kangsaoukella pontilimi]
MPALVPTDYTATIVWLGLVPHRDAPEIEANSSERLSLTFAGVESGEVHSGLTRPSCSRVTAQYPKGTEIRNTRQVSIVSEEELATIASALDLEKLDPRWLGATIVVRGIPDFSYIPPSSRLQAEDGATLTVDMQNRPCSLVARTIEQARPGHGKGFKAAAKGRRGVTAWVEREGALVLGGTLRLHIPDQRAWQPGG